MLTPHERAYRLSRYVGAPDMAYLIEQHIRDAENDALERAARKTADAQFMASIRALKHK